MIDYNDLKPFNELVKDANGMRFDDVLQSSFSSDESRKIRVDYLNELEQRQLIQTESGIIKNADDQSISDYELADKTATKLNAKHVEKNAEGGFEVVEVDGGFTTVYDETTVSSKPRYRQRAIIDDVIDFNKQLEPESFAHLTDKNGIKSTISNVEHLFKSYGINCDYDVILKKRTIKLGSRGVDDSDLGETAMHAEISSLIALNNMKSSCIDLLPAIFAKNQHNPIIDWITSEKWNKRDYIGQLLNSLVVADDDIRYKNRAVVTWLIQCVAAADSARSTPRQDAKPKYELVLILQGGQGIKKTSWFQALLPREMSQYIKDGVHLDPDKVDSKKKATSCWICELGEIGSTFRKSDIEQLKAFLSNTHDEMRLPYDRVESNFKRRTSFCGSVNQSEFLVDSTGARRFLPLSVIECNYQHGIDMQQLWAQVWHLYVSGSRWWCDDELETLLESRHEKHSETNPIHELISDKFDIQQTEKDERSQHLSITRILANAGIGTPNNQQVKQAKEFLEKCGFKSVQVTGNRGYWINFKP